MAVADAWWIADASIPTSRPTHILPHKNYPYNQNTKGISFSDLEEDIEQLTNHHCDVRKLIYKPETTIGAGAKWQLDKPRHVMTTTEVLVRQLQQNDPDEVRSRFYIVSQNNGESIQALGHYLSISPRFFNYPNQEISTGNTVKEYVFLHLQIMDKYKLQDRLPAKRLQTGRTPICQFRNKDGYAPHRWCSTRLAILFKRDKVSGKERYTGLFMVDPADKVTAEGLEKLITRSEERKPEGTEGDARQGLILSEMFYLVGFIWGVFLSEAEDSLQALSDIVTEQSISFDDQATYTKELHRFQPLWSQVRRRIIAAKDAVEQMVRHPYFTSDGTQKAFEAYLNKRRLNFEDQIDRTQKLVDQTDVLISLISNMATVKEGVYSASVRRITWMAALYLPLTLSASIFGMNIQQITSTDNQPHIGWFFFVAFVLIATTVTVWFIWRTLESAGRSRKDESDVPAGAKGQDNTKGTGYEMDVHTPPNRSS